LRPASVRPTGLARTFREDEVIVSKTDLRGHITYGNDIFLRVSAYDEDDVVGQPHNVIRHPDMPRSMFKLVWETLARGEEIFAYVINLAGDGAHYWVFAHMTPTFGQDGQITGYHSNRRTASRRAIDRVVPFYSELCAAEAVAGSGRDAVAAGTTLLNRKLQELGVDYAEFVWMIDPEVAA
jgi:PAS domain S-box-containing protein